MKIHTPHPGEGQYPWRKDLPVGRNHYNIRFPLFKRGQKIRRPRPIGCTTGNPNSTTAVFTADGKSFLSSAPRFIGLCDNAGYQKISAFSPRKVATANEEIP